MCQIKSELTQYKVHARPKSLVDEFPFPPNEFPSYVDCAFTFDVANYLDHRIFRRDQYHHVDMVGHQMTFFDLAFP